MSMFITVEKIEYEADRIIVTGSTGKNGMIKGVWISNPFPVPVEKGTYSAELSFDEYVKKVSKCPKTQTGTTMRENDTIVVFQGIIESVGEYCVCFNDAWFEWLPMLDIADDCSEISEGDYVTFSVQYYNIGIFPYDMLGCSPAGSKLPERTEMDKKQKKKKRTQRKMLCGYIQKKYGYSEKTSRAMVDKMLPYNDIFEEFYNYACVGKFRKKDKSQTEICGYTAEVLNRDFNLSPLGAYNFLVYLKEEPERAIADLKAGLPSKDKMIGL